MSLRIADLIEEYRELAPRHWLLSVIEHSPAARVVAPQLSQSDLRHTVEFRVEAEDATYTLMIEPESEQDAQLAAAIFPAAKRLAEQAYELASAKILKDNYAGQITQTFEELAWLRGLADNFALCDLRNDIFSLADRLMPELRTLINADEAVFLDPSYKLSSTAESAATDASSSRLPYSYPEIVEALCPADGPAVVVANAGMSEILRHRFPELFSAIVMRLSVGRELVGWIVAAKNYPDHITRDSLRSLTVEQQAYEFGTFEAGLLQSAATMLTTHGLNLRLMQDKELLIIAAVRSLVNAIEARDPYTFGHSERVASFARQIAQACGLNETLCEQIHMTGLLHDVGKIGVPDRVLLKPGKLDEEELAIIKRHPMTGYQILMPVPQLHYTLEGVRHHHERFDGLGYPDGLLGEKIPLFGRILAVADAYDAMTSSRPYRQAMPLTQALSILREGAGSYWDPKLIDIFFEVLRSNGVIEASRPGASPAPIMVAAPIAGMPIASAAT